MENTGNNTEFLEQLKKRVENAGSDDFALVIKGCNYLPELVGNYLTDEQWDIIKQMLTDGIDAKLNGTPKTSQSYPSYVVSKMTTEQKLEVAANIISNTCRKFGVDIEDYSGGDGFDLRVTITNNHTTFSKQLNIPLDI